MKERRTVDSGTPYSAIKYLALDMLTETLERLQQCEPEAFFTIKGLEEAIETIGEIEEYEDET